MMKSSYEFVSSAKDAGSQSTIVGGGRYSNLVKELGGPDLFGRPDEAWVLTDWLT